MTLAQELSDFRIFARSLTTLSTLYLQHGGAVLWSVQWRHCTSWATSKQVNEDNFGNLCSWTIGFVSTWLSAQIRSAEGTGKQAVQF